MQFLGLPVLPPVIAGRISESKDRNIIDLFCMVRHRARTRRLPLVLGDMTPLLLALHMTAARKEGLDLISGEFCS